MTADPLADPAFAERYRAMLARDDRFDGWFITGVHSTGIYCRPSCPAAPPKPTNVTFYRTAAAAHEAGLRASMREFFRSSVAVHLAHRQHRPVLVVPLSPVDDGRALPWE